MILGQFFNHAVAGYGGGYPRSKYEAGFGTAVGALVAVLFRDSPALFWLGTASAIGWAGFYLWALITAIRLDARKGDLDYDRRGKFALSKEYWKTESATSAMARKKKNG